MRVVKTAKIAAAGTAIGGSILFTAGLGLAAAQPDTAQDGLVNVAIGDIGVLENVEVAAAAQIAAGVCATQVDAVTSLVQTADTEGTEQTVCTNNLGTVTVQQNGPGQSENAPGQTGETSTEPTTTAPATPEAEEPSAEQG